MLKSLRLHKRLTQARLAKRASISQPYLALLEQGKKRNPSLSVLKGLAKALRTTTEAVIEALAGQGRGARR